MGHREDMQGDLWRHIVIDRRSTTPLYQQIVNAIRHRIATNDVPAQSRIPSVREMARLTDVTPATITRAYQLLKSEGLIEAIAGAGTVIADVRNIEHEARTRSIEALNRAVDDAITPLLNMGFTVEDIRVAFEQRLHHSSTHHSLVVVAAAKSVALKYVRLLRAALGTRFDIHPLVIAEIEAGHPKTVGLLKRANRCVTLLSLHHSVRRLLKPYAIPISLLLTQLSLKTLQQLEEISSNKDIRVGLVAEEFYQPGVLATLSQYFETDQIFIADQLEPAALVADLANVDVCIFTLGTSEVMAQTNLQGVTRFELVFEVREDSLERFLSFLPLEDPERPAKVDYQKKTDGQIKTLQRIS